MGETVIHYPTHTNSGEKDTTNPNTNQSDGGFNQVGC
jgi:hypothetical protein